MRLLLLAALLCGPRAARASRFELANVFAPGMVVQRGAPIVLWGWAAPGAAVYGAMKASDSNSSLFVSAQADAGSALFRLVFPAQAAGTFDFVVSSEPISDRCSEGPYLFSCAGWGIALSPVYVGDVVFCGGQSNMQVNVGFAFNASAELNAANALSGLVKVFQVAGVAMADEALDNVAISVPWSAASNVSLPGFSATCWYSGKSVALGRVGADRDVPLGLVSSCWGGTAIKVHASPAANAACGALYPGGNISAPGADCGLDHAPCAPSCLFHSMIAPFFAGPMAISAGIWFQGENDAATPEIAGGYYACQLARLIADWRAGFASPSAHFTTVQLAPYLTSAPLAAFRDMQCATAWAAANASCAVIVDDGDPLSPIGSVHSRNKELVGRRVAAGILAHVYGVDTAPTYQLGPRYAGVVSVNSAGSPLAATVAFAPESVVGGLVYVAPHVDVWQNSSRCPTELAGVTLALCGFFEILGSDGVYYNASSAVANADSTLTITAASAPAAVTVAGTRWGWNAWPVVNFYNAQGQPLVPWSANRTAVGERKVAT